MQFLFLVSMCVVGGAFATFKQEDCYDIEYVRQYVPHFEKVPVHKKIYKEVAVPKPVPKIVYETKFLTNYVTQTQYNPIYKTVNQPHYITETQYQNVYKTQYETKYSPQYVTQAEYKPQFFTKNVMHTQYEPFTNYVTVCPQYGGGAQQYGGGAQQLPAYQSPGPVAVQRAQLIPVPSGGGYGF